MTYACNFFACIIDIWQVLGQNLMIYCICSTIIIITIALLSILSEDEWGDLECLYEACQAAITDGSLFGNIMV